MIGDDDAARLREPPAELVGGRFAILAEAGTGGMGVVYRARDTSSGAIVALKIMTSESASAGARFARESHVLAELDHPAIVSCVAHGETEDGEPWLAMEWLDGVSLARRLAEGPLQWRTAITLARRVAEALDHAHARGVIHRDLKPANLFLAGGRVEDVKLLDFGIARAAPGEGLTRTGEIIGTPGYMAPEQARGVSDIDARADVFSLGCVLYRCVTGELPFAGADTLELLAKLVTSDPPPLRAHAKDAPAELEALVARMLAKKPEERASSAREVVDALERIERDTVPVPQGRTPSAEELAATLDARASLPAPTIPERRKRSALPIVAIGGVVAIAVVAALVIAGDDAEDTVHPGASAAPSPSSTHDAAARACRAWVDAVASAQHPDGTFGFERHREGHGWSSGQELFGLARAEGCAPIGHEVLLRRGAAGLATFRTDAGYFGSRRGAHEAETGATAWAALAYAALAARLHDPEDRRRALEARSFLLRARTPDGGFGLHPSETPGPAHPYITTLALFALTEVEPLDPSPEAIEARRGAAAWVRAALREEGDLSMREVAGLAEQAVWVLLREGAREERDPGDAALVAELARTFVERCDLHDGACRRGVDEDGAIDITGGIAGEDANFITCWHPWATLAAEVIARDRSIPITDETRGALEAIARWGVGEMDRGAALLRAAPSYKLAEYLFVASELAAEPRVR